ncbi:hypothetical protein [Nonomuraea rhodomycinica]|uniref:Uncharacterized protein n=1 Tax=Nonomuraea rhodomycinica TaxID=1712872 RepID=A0A7Y6MFG5_9ACTN|nr:hypothetical protein [Nonomuraea rhodomycinica]NUW44749.1 hypothetical protein [Nonomuraea rhodomycinica]
MADAWLGGFVMLLDVVVAVSLTAIVAVRTARRDAGVESGVIAGMAGPLLIWSVYLTVGPRLYDHVSQSEPYWLAWAGVPTALVTALAAATWAVGGERNDAAPQPAQPAK